MNELQRSMGRVEGSLDALTSELKEQRHATQQQLDSHDARLTHIERWKSRTKGYVLGGAAVIGILWKVLHA